MVNDTENASDWSIRNDMNNGFQIFGDRDFTVSNVPSYLVNAETIRTACDSKMYTSDLATFTAGSDITLYIAVDTRVNYQLSWLNSWTPVGTSLYSSNDVELALYKKDVNSGTKVTLGTNGGDGYSINYIVMAVPRQTSQPINNTPYVTNISVLYNQQYHQIRFSWKPVSGATNYGIAVYLAGKWRVQTSSLPASATYFTTPKNLTPGMTYKVAIAAKVNGDWNVNNAIKNAVIVTVQ